MTRGLLDCCLSKTELRGGSAGPAKLSELRSVVRYLFVEAAG